MVWICVSLMTKGVKLSSCAHLSIFLGEMSVQVLCPFFKLSRLFVVEFHTFWI